MLPLVKAKYPIKIAAKADRKALKRFYKDQHYSASLIGFDTCYLIVNGDNIIASAILSYGTQENNQALLHAVVVDKQYQKQGIATELINIIKQQHIKNLDSSIVCFAKPELATFYQALSFNLVAQEQKLNDNLRTNEEYPLKISLTEINFKRFSAYQKNMPAIKAFIVSEIL